MRVALRRLRNVVGDPRPGPPGLQLLQDRRLEAVECARPFLDPNILPEPPQRLETHLKSVCLLVERLVLVVRWFVGSHDRFNKGEHAKQRKMEPLLLERPQGTNKIGLLGIYVRIEKKKTRKKKNCPQLGYSIPPLSGSRQKIVRVLCSLRATLV